MSNSETGKIQFGDRVSVLPLPAHRGHVGGLSPVVESIYWHAFLLPKKGGLWVALASCPNRIDCKTRCGHFVLMDGENAQWLLDDN